MTMPSLLARVDRASLAIDPFPHIVLRDALPEDLYARLAAEYPATDVIAESSHWGSNTRYSLTATKALDNPAISPLWRAFVHAHTSQQFLDQLVGIFADQIRALYPDFERAYAPLDRLRRGIRNRDSFDDADVLLDAQISINTPVQRRASSVRGLHLDRPNKLFVGLFYMRHSADTSQGGDLELGRYRDGPAHFQEAELDARHVEVTKTVRYDRNVLVLFPNSIDALHGVTARSVTEHPRYLFNLVAEVRAPLFDLSPYQARHGRLAALSGGLRGFMSASSRRIRAVAGSAARP